MSRARDLADSADKDIVGTLNVDGLDVDGAVNMATTALVTGVLTTTAATVFNGGFASNATSNFGDGNELRFGADNDLAIFHSSGVNNIRSDAGTLKIRSDDMRFTAQNGSSEFARFDSSGNLGIGTSSTTNFTNGTVVEAAGGTNTGAFLASSNNGTVVAEVQGNNADGLTYFGSRTNHPVVFRQNGSERMRLDSAGTLFLGTTSPPLHSGTTGIVFDNGCLLTEVARGASKSLTLAQNLVIDSGNTWAYLSTDEASYYQQFNGTHYFGTAPSGTAGADATVISNMKINASGEISGTSFQENYAALSGTTPSIDADTGGYYSLTTSGNTTFTFAAVTTGRSVGFLLEITAGGAHNLIWPSAAGTSKVFWAGGTAPDAPASGAKNLYVFVTRDSGTNWIGALASAAYA